MKIESNAMNYDDLVWGLEGLRDSLVGEVTADLMWVPAEIPTEGALQGLVDSIEHGRRLKPERVIAAILEAVDMVRRDTLGAVDPFLVRNIQRVLPSPSPALARYDDYWLPNEERHATVAEWAAVASELAKIVQGLQAKLAAQSDRGDRRG
jgi:hypothetical protein